MAENDALLVVDKLRKYFTINEPVKQIVIL